MNFKYSSSLAENEQRLSRLEQEKKVVRIQRYSMALKNLAEEVELDHDEELSRCADMGEHEFQTRLAQIRQNNQSPTAALEDPDTARQIHRYMLDNPKWTQEQGEKAYKEAAKILKYCA